jgi:hypothetical protein
MFHGQTKSLYFLHLIPELIFYAIVKLERYPDKFEAREKGVYNKMLDEFVSSNPDESDDPLLKASRLTQEDWCIMEWKEEHQAYCLTAGLIFTVLILRRHFPNSLECTGNHYWSRHDLYVDRQSRSQSNTDTVLEYGHLQ